MADCKKLTSSIFFESLILAQDERWRRALGMQVERSGEQSTDGGEQIADYQRIDYSVIVIRDVTDLRIYQLALQLLKPLSKLAGRIPDRELRFQLMDAAKAIAAMIAEGYAKKRSLKEFKRFLEMSLGSSDEVITHLREVAILFDGLKNEAENLIIQYKSLSKQISATITKWN